MPRSVAMSLWGRPRLAISTICRRSRSLASGVARNRISSRSASSGGRAGYDGAKKRKGSKVHLAVDALGNLLALTATAAGERERARAAAPTARLQEAIGGAVQVASADRGHTGDAAAGQAEANGIR